MTLISDDREPEDIKKFADKVSHLTYGDFCVHVGNEMVYAERKTYTDAWNSLRSGRLDRQLFDLSKHSVTYCLILEKAYVPPQAQKLLYAVITKVNKMAWAFPIIHTLNKTHTINELRAIERRLQEGTFRTVRRPIEHVDDTDPRVRVVASIPGLGPKKARAIIERYGSVSEAFRNVDHWSGARGVDGVGPKLVSKAKEVLES